MGQYYETLFIDERQYMYPLDYGFSGLKLMEHSWVGGSYRNGVIAHLIKLGKCRLVHLGDYSNTEIEENYNKSIDVGDICIPPSSMYDMCWTSGIEDKFRMPRISDMDISEFRWKKSVWIANEDQHEYIKCDYELENKDEWKVCPLLILLAVGNGNGGGDYHGINMDMVGKWAFDTIKVYDSEPVGMYNLEEEGPLFKEGY